MKENREQDRKKKFPALGRASITVEASMTVPLFFLAVVCLFYLMEMMVVHTAVRSALQYAGKEAAQEGAQTAVLIPSRIESYVVHAIGADRLERSIVKDGSSGISCGGSYLSARTGIGEVVAVYQVKIPVRLFHIASIRREERLRIKAWTGYEKGAFETTDEEIVYVTETGVVYHRDYHCTHLDLSVRMVSRSQMEHLRNSSGAKYHACERCGGGGGGVYITDDGTRYHSSLSCSGLKRTVYAVPVSELAGKPACSKCGGK